MTSAEFLKNRIHLWLLASYVFVPLGLVLVLIDQIFSDGRIQRFLPFNPETYAIYTGIVLLPHVISSFVTFAHVGSFSHYKSKIFLSFLIALLFIFVLPALVGTGPALSILLAWTIIHLITQQFGINGAFLKSRNFAFKLWHLLGLLIGLLIVFSTYYFEKKKLPVSTDAKLLAAFASVVFFAVGLVVLKHSSNRFGRLYTLCNCAFIFSSVIFFVMNYPFLGFLIPRLIHNSTAHVFYHFHEVNRKNQSGQNYLLNFFRLDAIGVGLGLPVLALFLSAPLMVLPAFVVQSILTLLSIGHYSMETIIWKSGSLHRAYINLH